MDLLTFINFIEALADGGVRSGLPRASAMELAAHTVKGAANMALKTGEHPGKLKDNVTHPGVTKIFHFLLFPLITKLNVITVTYNRGFHAATISAVIASTKRSMQLGGISEEDIRHVHNL